MPEGRAPETADREARLTVMRDALRARAAKPNTDEKGCGLCYRILEDLEDGKLTGALMDGQGHPTFPRSGQLAHLQVEGITFNEADL